VFFVTNNVPEYPGSMLLPGPVARGKELNRERNAWKLLGEMFRKFIFKL